MKFSKTSDDSSKISEKLRNFDLSVEEIKIVRTIKDLTESLEDIELHNAQPERMEFYRNEIKNLKDQLEEIRENTLI